MAEASRDSGYVDNWQTGKTVTECNLHMLTTEDCSDVIFRVGSEKHVVRAHRYVLVSRSCVFHAMFCGPLAEKGEVTIPDIEIEVFREFLRYLYTDTANITADNVTGLLYTSRKYAVDTLLNQCAAFLENSLTEETVCQILEQCHGYGELDLEQKSLKILIEGGDQVIKSAGFLDLCSGCLEKFLKSDDLKLEEENVFEAALSWAKEKCKKENVNTTPENLRRFLEEMMYEIRFTLLPLEYLVNVVGASQILTAEERMKLVDKSFQPTLDITPFKSSPRNNRSEEKQHLHCVTRFTTLWAGTTGIPYSNEALSFSTSSDIQLVGCQLYGPCTLGESTYDLNILIYDDQEQVIVEPVPKSILKLKGLKNLNDILFPAPVLIVAGRTYTVCVKMNGEKADFGKGGLKAVDESGVTFTFKNSPMSSFWTKTIKGQIPGLIWR